MRHAPSATLIRSALLAVLSLGGLAACGSGAASSDAPATEPTALATDPGVAATAAPPSAASAAGGARRGTLTMADGTVYALEMTACDTSENAEGFLLPDSYDLFGRTSDGAFAASINRAGMSEDFISEIVTLEGDFDENGKNAGILYRNVLDTIALTVDGGNVTGTVTFKAIGPAGPHGEQMDATVDISC